MAGGQISDGGDGGTEFGGELTASLFIVCIVAAFGGLIFGFDVGISGGVTTMESFLSTFFPSILKRMADSQRDEYCVFDSQILTSFTSSLYVAGLIASLAAAKVTNSMGRQKTMLFGALTFLFGAVVNAVSVNIAMLILGRLFLGMAIGFTNQATPIYISEMAPTRMRGALNIMFQFFLGLGVVASNLINYATAQIPHWGWRLSLGLAAIPAVIMIVGTLLIPDTPRSLVQRGHQKEARLALRRLRGTNTDIEPEMNELIRLDEIANSVKHEPFKTIVQSRYRPHLVMSIAIPFFQQMTGINVIAFYAPVLFQTVGFGSSPALVATVLLGAVNLISIIFSSIFVDKYGRRFLFILGGTQMFICEIATGIILRIKAEGHSSPEVIKIYSVVILVIMCIYSAGFGWSWGPLTWLVPSEIFPIEIRAAGQSIAIGVNFLITFILAQFFLAMLCRFKYLTFIFYGGWIVIMTVFIILFLPETRGVPLESMNSLWENHWFWSRYYEKKTTKEVDSK